MKKWKILKSQTKMDRKNQKKYNKHRIGAKQDKEITLTIMNHNKEWPDKRIILKIKAIKITSKKSKKILSMRQCGPQM